MIRVFSFQPEYFNNNGDQGNLEALAHYLSEDLEFVPIQDAEFALVGDASRAAMRKFEPELSELVTHLGQRLEAGLPTLLVGSSYEYFAGKVTGLKALEFGSRASEFRVAAHNGLQLKGYRNSEVISQDLFTRGAFVATTLFGPVLAKNLPLVELFAQSLGRSVNISAQEKEWISKI